MSISEPEQLSIKNIANKLKLKIFYGKVSLRFDNNIVIKRSTEQQEWQLFGEEVGHYLRHIGNHVAMHDLFRDYQEYQASYFAYHFCVPTFMLQQIDNITTNEIMKTFNVESCFASRRIEIHERKMIDERTYHQAR